MLEKIEETEDCPQAFIPLGVKKERERDRFDARVFFLWVCHRRGDLAHATCCSRTDKAKKESSCVLPRRGTVLLSNSFNGAFQSNRFSITSLFFLFVL